MTSTTFVCTLDGKTPKWSRYTFPFDIDAFAQLGDTLYIRTGDTVVKMVRGATTDQWEDGVPGEAIPGTCQWNWLDFGQPGVTKQVEGFDLVATGSPSVSFGYDQRDTDAFTSGYAIDPDTLNGMIVPYPLMLPTLSVKLTFNAAPWSVSEFLLYTQPQRPAT